MGGDPAAPIRIIAGLGNPGAQYHDTRHNAGFWFADDLERRFEGRFHPEQKFHGDLARVAVNGNPVFLFKPTTFMNRSGQALRAIADFYKVSTAGVLVVHDEIDLPPGTVRLKRGGGHGGHNGLRDIVAHLGRDFWRLRIGVGHPGHRDQVIQFVLARPDRDAEGLIRAAMDEALSVIPLVVGGDMERAMHRLHSDPG